MKMKGTVLFLSFIVALTSAYSEFFKYEPWALFPFPSPHINVGFMVYRVVYKVEYED